MAFVVRGGGVLHQVVSESQIFSENVPATFHTNLTISDCAHGNSGLSTLEKLNKYIKRLDNISHFIVGGGKSTLNNSLKYPRAGIKIN